MDAVAEIKAKVDLAEYIGRTTPLQRSGRNFKGNCPFHTEKTPSFYVFPERGNWRCFGSCAEGGDLFSFVQKRENVDFRGALRTLAREAGIELSAESAQKRSRVERLSAVVSAAVDFYQRQLRDPGGEDALRYLTQTRGLSEDTIASFHLGWAPDEWRLLRDHLTARGYDEGEALAAGLLVEPESGPGNPYDRFRGRVIVPIADERGQFVGLGGRGLKGEEPKYLNSPQSELFDKGRTLYGLNLAATGIREGGVAVVVEGYMDVMGPWQAGFRNVVATMGTSLTEAHVALLRRSTRKVVLAMDPDAAGMAAAERAGGLFIGLSSPEEMSRSVRSADQLFSATELDLRVAPLPSGLDPDEIARDDPKAWGSAIDGAVPYAEFLLQRIMGPGQPESPLEARRLVDRMRPVLLAVSDPVERGVYLQRVARHLGVSEGLVLERVRQGMPRFSRRANVPAGMDRDPEETLLSFLLRYPHLRTDMRNLPVNIFTKAINRELFRKWLGAEDLAELAADDPLVEHVRTLEARRLPGLSLDDARRAVQSGIRSIMRERAIQHQVAISEQLAEAERTLGANHVAALGNDVWRGAMPSDESLALAELVIEELELGLSIHRREGPELS